MSTATDLRDATLATALGQLGYTSGNYEWSRYGIAANWASPWLWGNEWQGMYCNRFLSWAVDQVMGAEAGQAAVGRQPLTALPVGFAATWLQREWFRANDRHVGFANSQPGDYYLFKLPGRQANPTNHVGMFVKWHIPGKVAVTVEGNLQHPVTRTTSSIGVHLHYRDIAYVVAVYRPGWQAAAKVYDRLNPTPAQPAPAPGGLSMSDVQKILDAIERTPAGVWAYRNPGYPGRDAHGYLRDGKAADAKLLAAVSKAIGQPVDVKGLAQALLPELIEAVKGAGDGATAEQVADELARRLNQED